MMLASQRIFKRFGWGAAALITPTMLFLTGTIFFSLILFGNALSPLVAALGTTPLMLAVIVGAAQNVRVESRRGGHARRGCLERGEGGRVRERCARAGGVRRVSGREGGVRQE